jgi:hypothetical protein
MNEDSLLKGGGADTRRAMPETAGASAIQQEKVASQHEDNSRAGSRSAIHQQKLFLPCSWRCPGVAASSQTF